MQAQSLEQVIDAAAEVCGGQNALARRLGMPSGNLSAARAGKRPFPAAKCIEVATLLGIDAATVWQLAQERKNPFRQSATAALAGYLIAIMAVVLAFALPSESQALTRLSARSAVIVHARKRSDHPIHWRALLGTLAGAASRVLWILIGPGRPMLPAC